MLGELKNNILKLSLERILPQRRLHLHFEPILEQIHYYMVLFTIYIIFWNLFIVVKQQRWILRRFAHIFIHFLMDLYPLKFGDQIFVNPTQFGNKL